MTVAQQQQEMPARQAPIPPPQSASVLQGYPQLQRQVLPLCAVTR